MHDATVADLLHQAMEAERLGRFDGAREALRTVVARENTPVTQEARLRLGKLLIYGGLQHGPEAEAVLQAARSEAEQSGAPRQTAAAVHLLALLERHRGRHDQALQLLDGSPVPRQAGAPGPETGQWFHYRGLLAADRGELAHAERLYFRAHQAYQEVRYDPGLAEVCDSLANLLLRHGKSRAALAFAQASLQSKRKLGDRYGEAVTLGTVGRIYLLQARYAEAREAFAADLAIARELNDQRGIGIMLNSLGEVALLQKDLAGAADWYRQSLAADPGAYNGIHAHLGLARVHLAAGRLGEAAAECGQAAELLGRHPKVHGLPDLLAGLRGAVAWRQGETETGERLLSEAIDALGRQNQAQDTIPLLYELRDLYQHHGETARAVKVMTRALDLLSECGAERGVNDVEDWLRTVDCPSLTRLALERHFPDHVVEGILSGRLETLATHRQEVTVLFSDVRDYTTLSEALPPEQVVELLNEWFTEATRAVRRHGGMVDKFIGDAVMALFGVPEPRPDAAADAVRAAVEMRDALCALNLRQKALGGREIHLGIGIHTGEVVIGFIGSHLRQSYTAIGDPVNVASRLESATKRYPGCDILLSEITEERQRVYQVAETVFLGYEELKGRQQKVAIHQVRGLRQA